MFHRVGKGVRQIEEAMTPEEIQQKIDSIITYLESDVFVLRSTVVEKLQEVEDMLEELKS